MVVRTAGYTAHHIIALAFMIIVTTVGFAGWFSLPASATASASARMLTSNGTARWLAAVLIGELIIWDFPCSFFIKKLRDPVLLTHHVGMLITAYLVARLPTFYGLFYLGWTELSNIPLQLWDWFSNAEEDAGKIAEKYSAYRLLLLTGLKKTSFAIFSIFFFFVRVVAFTGITLGGLFPDVYRTLCTPAGVAAQLPLVGFLFFGAAFNGLMLFWFVDKFEDGKNAIGDLLKPLVRFD